MSTTTDSTRLAIVGAGPGGYAASETIMEAAEVFFGQSTHRFRRRRG